MELGLYNFKKEQGLAWFGILLLIVIYWVKVIANPNRQTTYDSWQYVALADKLIKGDSWWKVGQVNSAHNVFVPYSPAYPTAIAVVVVVTDLPTFSASKLLGMMLLLLNWSLLLRLNRNLLVFWFALISSSSCMHIYTHTWSEGLMLTSTLLMAICSKHHYTALTGACITALTRLAAWPIMLAYFVVGMLRGNKNQIIASLISLGLFISWIAFESLHSGLLSGGDREVNLKGVQWNQFFKSIAESISFRNLQESEPLWIIFQLILTVLVCFFSLKRMALNKESGLTLVMVGLFYLFQNLAFSAFYVLAEGNDVRIVYPGVFLVIAGLACRFTTAFEVSKLAYVIMVGLTLIQLPWRYLVSL